MQGLLGRYSEQLYAFMRIVAGLAFTQHGAQKLFGLLGGHKVALVSRLGLAGVIELGAGVLIAIGLFASWAAFVAAGEMAVAYFVVHFPQGPWPIRNRGELALLYCVVFLFIAAKGAGRWSLWLHVHPTVRTLQQ
jgi:putative oxidoreductase